MESLILNIGRASERHRSYFGSGIAVETRVTIQHRPRSIQQLGLLKIDLDWVDFFIIGFSK